MNCKFNLEIVEKGYIYLFFRIAEKNYIFLANNSIYRCTCLRTNIFRVMRCVDRGEK